MEKFAELMLRLLEIHSGPKPHPGRLLEASPEAVLQERSL
jgi:hypothetical protein